MKRFLLGMVFCLAVAVPACTAQSQPPTTAPAALLTTKTLFPTSVFTPSSSPTHFSLLPTATLTFTAIPPTKTSTVTPTATTAEGIGSTRMSLIDGMLQVYVPSGDFLMGSDKAKDPNANPDEMPQHTVFLDSYWIDRTEVTNGMYALCVAAGGCTKPITSRSFYRSSYYGNSQYADYPVVYVNWKQASSYCQWAGQRLPTEAEWEKASRGTDGRIYPWGNQVNNCTLENFQHCQTETTKVGSYPAGASPYGALDMSGNVWEWVADWFSDTYYQNSPENNPAGPAQGEHRSLRGGGWGNFDVWISRSADRAWFDPSDIAYSVGFRCAVSAGN